MVSFLDLPLNARHLIYAYAHLFRYCPIELNRPYIYTWAPVPLPGPPTFRPSWHTYFGLEGTSRGCLYRFRRNGCDKSVPPGTPDCVCFRLPLHLLLVSRAVYQDVFSVFYSKNQFVIRLADAGGFESLRLSPHILSTLTSLLIRLNCWPCLRGHDRTCGDGSTCTTCRAPAEVCDPPLYMASQAGQTLLDGWRRFAERLASSILPGQLQLTLICDVMDTASGIAVLEPLLQFPTMKQCVIRLGRCFDYELYKLAREASLRAQGLYCEAPGIFPFQRLPRKLRLQILRHTHLGDHNSYSEVDRLLRIRKNKLEKADFCSPCCRKCTETLIDCCCTPSYAAFSLNCDCRHIPFELSLVSKEMRADMMEVLLSQNCFEFCQDPEETISFLRNFPRGTLKYARRIQLTFNENEIVEWDQLGYRKKLTGLINFIRDNFDLERLSITVLIDSYDLGCFVEGEEDTRFIYDVYCDITQVLSLLPVLEDIQFKLGWFSGLGLLMKGAILGEQHPKYSLEGQQIVPLEMRESIAFRIPKWYREVDFMTW